MLREIPHQLQAYAKIVGTGWEYYMVKPRIVLGRGGVDVDCDVVLSNESAVSRRHFAIRFAPEHQAIEVENFGKNGILVNGDFVPRLSAPVLLRSQAEIAYGKYDFMRITLILPASTRMGQQSIKRSKAVAAVPTPTVDLTEGWPEGGGVSVEVAPGRYTNGSTVGQFPNGGQGDGGGVHGDVYVMDGDGDVNMGNDGDGQTVGGGGASEAPAFIPLLQWVGEVLAVGEALPPATICSRVRSAHRRQLGHMTETAFRNSVRHVLMQNDHLFYVVDPVVHYGGEREGNAAGSAGEGVVAKFAVREEERGRFIQFAQASHANPNGAS